MRFFSLDHCSFFSCGRQPLTPVNSGWRRCLLKAFHLKKFVENSLLFFFNLLIYIDIN